MYHLEAIEFLGQLEGDYHGALLDPPYSPRQVSECYKSLNLPVSMEDTQNARLYTKAKVAINRILQPGAIVICCGWNSAGMGRGKNYYELIEILLVCHGSAHNDTICTVERKIQSELASQGK